MLRRKLLHRDLLQQQPQETADSSSESEHDESEPLLVSKSPAIRLRSFKPTWRQRMSVQLDNKSALQVDSFIIHI